MYGGEQYGELETNREAWILFFVSRKGGKGEGEDSGHLKGEIK